MKHALINLRNVELLAASPITSKTDGIMCPEGSATCLFDEARLLGVENDAKLNTTFVNKVVNIFDLVDAYVDDEVIPTMDCKYFGGTVSVLIFLISTGNGN